MPRSIPLLLLPSLLCDARVWGNQIKPLEMLAESHVADLTQHNRIEDLARAALASAPPQFAVAGISMGGYVALEIMRQAPERVLKLCLIDSSARADSEEQRQRRGILLALAQTGTFKGVTPRLLPTIIYPERINEHEKELGDLIIDMAQKIGREAFTHQQTAIINRIDSRPYLKYIQCPTQVIGGAQDLLTPPDVMREMAEGIPGARFDLIEKCGHLSPLERPDEVTMLMTRWLTG